MSCLSGCGSRQYLFVTRNLNSLAMEASIRSQLWPISEVAPRLLEARRSDTAT